ncbi:MAG: hypothetical protein ACFHWZ_06870 [Phycisphaerales bacterium]
MTGCMPSGGGSYGYGGEGYGYSGGYGGYGSYGGYASGYTTPRTATISIESEIVSGTRTTDEYGDTSVDITVSVIGKGEPLGYYKSSTLYLMDFGAGFASTSDRWSDYGLGSGDWPSAYRVEAEYTGYLGTDGTVTVTVEIDDMFHDRHRDEIYRAVHRLSWE